MDRGRVEIDRERERREREREREEEREREMVTKVGRKTLLCAFFIINFCE